MSWIPDRYRRLRSLLGAESIEDEVDEELRLHLELRAADFVARGMSQDEARDEALRRFGDIERVGSETYAIDEGMRKEQRRMELMDSLRREVRHAFRSLARAPLFTVFAVLTLGLGIGATTAIFTLLDAIVLRPLPYPEPDRLVQLRHAVPKVGPDELWGNSVASYFFYSDNNTVFEEIGAFSTGTYTLSGDGEADRVDGASVSASTLRLLGVRTVRGRLFTDAETGPDAATVALISHELWQSRYGSDPSIIGRTIQVNSSPVTVVGVVERRTRVPRAAATSVWLPLMLDRAAPPVNWHWVGAYGRLRPGVTTEAAQRDLQQLANRMPEEFPGAYSTEWYESSGFTPDVTPLRSMVIGRIDRVLGLLLAAVSIVLLIAGANVANLYLVRMEARRREHAVRSALGAERAHLALQYVTESTLLGLGSAAVGVLLAFIGVKLLVLLSPPGIPRLDEVSLGVASAGFAMIVALFVSTVFGLVPVLRNRDHSAQLREGGRGSTASRERQFARNTLVVVQVGLALILLTAGGLMLQTFINLNNVDSGIEPDDVTMFTAFTPSTLYPTRDDQIRFRREVVEGVAALPGVTGVSAAVILPFSGDGGCSYTTLEGKQYSSIDLPPCMPVNFVLPDYFEVMGIDVAGESFTWSDVDRKAAVAIVSRAFAERMWPGEDPVGKGVISYQDGPPWYRVIGVADDVRGDGLDRPPVEMVYYPPHVIAGAYPGGGAPSGFVVRAAPAVAGGLPESIRAIVSSIDSNVPIGVMQPMNDLIRESDAVARSSFTLLLLGVAATMALFLSAVGLYGVIAYLVGVRRSEIGVRMALGARVSGIARMVIAQSLRLTAVGLVIGIAGSLLTGRVLESLLFGVQPGDPRVLVLVSAVLLLVALLASAIPARRAARTDPSEALRSE